MEIKLQLLPIQQFKEIFKNNCDILVVQTPTSWMDRTKEGKEVYYPEKYTETFKSLVDKYVSENNIAKDRIYIGGCSMGGFMTMNMILSYPTYFAAYFAAEAYLDEYISDEQIHSYVVYSCRKRWSC